MTTVAWDGKTLAADRKISSQGAVWRAAPKLREIPGGYIACAGNIEQIARFLKWVHGGKKGKVPDLDDFGAIAVVHGHVTVWENGSEIPCVASERIAIGSGWAWATAAMDHGKTAVEAIEYAATRDNSTGCGVDSVRPTQRKAKK